MNKLVDFSWDDQPHYGLLLSGGLDSAVMLALIIKLNPTLNIQPFTMMKSDGSYKCVDMIVDNINNKLGSNIPYSIMIDDPGNGMVHRSYGEYTTKYILSHHRDKVDFLFNGVNQNPEELANYNGAPQRAPAKDHPRVIMPFVNYIKEDIVRWMFEYNLDFLSDITHTCTRLPSGRCGVCFQCQERKLAYIMNDKVDTGVR